MSVDAPINSLQKVLIPCTRAGGSREDRHAHQAGGGEGRIICSNIAHLPSSISAMKNLAAICLTILLVAPVSAAEFPSRPLLAVRRPSLLRYTSRNGSSRIRACPRDDRRCVPFAASAPTEQRLPARGFVRQLREGESVRAYVADGSLPAGQISDGTDSKLSLHGS